MSGTTATAIATIIAIAREETRRLIASLPKSKDPPTVEQIAAATLKRLRAPKDGKKGDIGERGERGERGSKGEKGDHGRDGKDGLNGKDGKDGKDGRDGVDGQTPAVDYVRIIKEAIATIPRPRDGVDGKPAKPPKLVAGEIHDTPHWEAPKFAVHDRGSGTFELELWMPQGRPGGGGGGGVTLRTVIDLIAEHAPPGGGGAWGSITGTLSDQTDLQIVFDAKEDAGTAAAAVAAHEGAGDPHPQYLTAAEGNAAYEAAGAVAAHAAAADPHTGYQKESEKDAASGYPGLSASSKLNGAQQTYGSSANTACEGNDSRLSDSRAPNGAAGGDLGGSYPSPTVTQARGLRETAGPTTLVMAAVADGEFLKRVGATVVGGTPVAALPDLVYSKRILTADFTLPADTGAVIPQDFEVASGITLELASNAIMDVI